MADASAPIPEPRRSPACGGGRCGGGSCFVVPSPARGGGLGWGAVSLPPLEHRAALFHEGGAALGIVLAGKTAGDDFLAQRHVPRGFVLDRLADDDIGGAHG